MTQSSLPSRWLITSPNYANDPDIFPLLPGFSFITSKEPTWQTVIQQASSGRERRRQQWSYPLWNFNVGYEVLRDGPTYAEQQKLLAFFNSKAGRYQEFFFFDPSDNQATNTQFSTGDGGTTVFPLYRIVGATPGAIYWLEPVKALYGTVQPYIAGVPCNLVRNGGFELQTGGQPYGFFPYSSVTQTLTAPTGRSGSGLAYGLRATSTGSGVLGVLGGSLVNPGGGIVGGVAGGWNAYTTYTIAFWARKIGGAAWSNMSLAWNIAPASTTAVVNPSLSSSWQRYAFTFTWGGAVETVQPCGFYVSIAGAAIAINDEIQIDDLQITMGADIGSAAASSFSVSAPGQITFDTAPVNGAVLTWTGQYMFPVRFADDKLTAKQLMQGLWSAEGINLVGVKS